MGIPHFTTLFPVMQFNFSSFIEPFDSILIDAQSLFYMSIGECPRKQWNPTIIKIKFVRRLGKILTFLFNKFKENHVHVVISMDGKGVPMKFDAQSRQKNSTAAWNRFFFGRNAVHKIVYDYLLEVLRNWQEFRDTHLKWARVPPRITFVLSGYDNPGEGEHKLFRIAALYALKDPIIMSLDNDVFILSLLRADDFDSVQIGRACNKIYNISRFTKYHLSYDSYYLVRASLLFGNDFVYPIVTLSKRNVQIVHEAIHSCTGSRTLPVIFCTVLSALDVHKALKFNRVPCIHSDLVIDFYKICFWILDYYTKDDFPQKYLRNEMRDKFDRNLLITTFLDLELSTRLCSEAQTHYAATCTARPTFRSGTPSEKENHDSKKSQLIEVYVSLRGRKPPPNRAGAVPPETSGVSID